MSTAMLISNGMPLCKTSGRCVRVRADSARSEAASVASQPQTGSGALITSRNNSKAEHLPVQRRALGALLLSPALLAAQGFLQEATASTVDYQDKEDGFSLVVPKDWTFAVPQQPYDRFRSGVSTTRTLVWYPEGGTDVNVSMVITTPGADYTSLASFGSAQDFGANLVASMDRSFTRGKGRPTEEVQVATLVKAASDGAGYGVEYTIQKGEEEQKHLYSRVMMGSNGRFRRFYTITATCPESQVGEVGPVLKSAVASLAVERMG